MSRLETQEVGGTWGWLEGVLVPGRAQGQKGLILERGEGVEETMEEAGRGTRWGLAKQSKRRVRHREPQQSSRQPELPAVRSPEGAGPPPD